LPCARSLGTTLLSRASDDRPKEAGFINGAHPIDSVAVGADAQPPQPRADTGASLFGQAGGVGAAPQLPRLAPTLSRLNINDNDSSKDTNSSDNKKEFEKHLSKSRDKRLPQISENLGGFAPSDAGEQGNGVPLNGADGFHVSYDAAAARAAAAQAEAVAAASERKGDGAGGGGHNSMHHGPYQPAEAGLPAAGALAAGGVGGLRPAGEHAEPIPPWRSPVVPILDNPPAAVMPIPANHVANLDRGWDKIPADPLGVGVGAGLPGLRDSLNVSHAEAKRMIPYAVLDRNGDMAELPTPHSAGASIILNHGPWLPPATNVPSPTAHPPSRSGWFTAAAGVLRGRRSRLIFLCCALVFAQRAIPS